MRSTVWKHKFPRGIVMNACYRCGMRLTDDGYPDPTHYPPAWIKRYYSTPEDQHCQHRTSGEERKTNPVLVSRLQDSDNTALNRRLGENLDHPLKDGDVEIIAVTQTAQTVENPSHYTARTSTLWHGVIYWRKK